MRLRRRLLTTTLAMALASPVLLQSAEPLAEPLNPGLVETLGNGFFVAPPMEARLVVTNVRVFNDDNELVLSERTLTDSVQLLAADLPDGKYRYEVVSVFELAEPAGSGADRGEFTSQRNFGSFEVQAGAIMPRGPDPSRDQSRRDDLSMLDRMTDKAMKLAGMTLDFLVPSAQAANLTASSAEPVVHFDDTDTAGGEWNVWGLQDAWGVANLLGDNNHWVFRVDGAPGSTLNSDSIIVDTDGDIHLAGGGMNFDRGVSALSIGTMATGGVDLNIHDTDPDIRLYNETWSDWFVLKYDGFNFSTSFNGTVDITKVSYGAPADSLWITGDGTVALAAGNALHVGSTTTPVGQFTITSPDQPRFEMNDTTTGKRWRFSVASNKFAINNLDVPGTEFQVFDNGDVLIAGALTQFSDVNAKQDIVPVDRHNVLAKIAGLPISEWSYKDAPEQRHVGPMAQDFYAAFGLGRNEKGISTLDSSGIALAGIQALAEDNAAIRAQNEALLQHNAELSKRLADLERQQAETQAVMVRLLEAQHAQPVLTRNLAN